MVEFVNRFSPLPLGEGWVRDLVVLTSEKLCGCAALLDYQKGYAPSLRVTPYAFSPERFGVRDFL